MVGSWKTSLSLPEVIIQVSSDEHMINKKTSYLVVEHFYKEFPCWVGTTFPETNMFSLKIGHPQSTLDSIQAAFKTLMTFQLNWFVHDGILVSWLFTLYTNLYNKTG